MLGLGSFLLVAAAGCAIVFGCRKLTGAEAKLKTENSGYVTVAPEPVAPLNKAGTTLETRFPAPKGFTRREAGASSFAWYLRHLPLKPHGSPVLLHTGAVKERQDVHAAAIDLDIGDKDLQQCADAVIRLRAEYLFKVGREADIHFNFTSGDRAAFTQYAKGYRPVFSRNAVTWQLIGAPDNSYKSFRKYLDLVFTYAGTASLEKELMSVPNFAQIKPGDVLITGGHPGHAVMVLDVAENGATGQKLILLGQSYMPAQTLHVLINPNSEVSSPWYDITQASEIKTPEWPAFQPAHAKRFRD